MEKDTAKSLVPYAPPTTRDSREQNLDWESVISKHALDYLNTHSLKINLETLQIARGIVLDALHLSPPPPQLKTALLSRHIKEGLEKRKQEHAELASLLSYLKSPTTPQSHPDNTNAHNLGLTTEELKSAQTQLAHYKSTPNPSLLRTLATKVELRLELIRPTTLAIVENLLGRPQPTALDPNPVERHFDPRLPTALETQSKVIRGTIATIIAKSVSPNCDLNPLLFLPASLETLAELFDPPPPPELLVSFATRLANSLRLPKQVDIANSASFIHDLAIQVMTAVQVWRRSPARRERTSPHYWEKMTDTFYDLPTQPLFGAGWITDPDYYNYARDHHLPHIWLHPIQKGDYLLPSLQDLNGAYSALLRLPGAEHIRIKIKRAIDAWKRYLYIQEKYPPRLLQLETKITSMPDAPITADDLRNRVLKETGHSPQDLLALGVILPTKLDGYSAFMASGQLSSDVRQLKSNQHALDMHKRFTGILTGQPDPQEENIRPTLVGYIRARLDAATHQLTNLITQKERSIRIVAESPSWADFPNPTTWSIPRKNLAHEISIDAEISQLSHLISEMETHPSLALPESYMTNRPQLLQFISWYIRRLPNTKEADTKRKRMQVVASLLVTTLSPSKRYLRSWFLHECRLRLTQLQRIKDLENQIPVLKSDIKLLTQCTSEAYPTRIIHLLEGLSNPTENYTQWIALRTLPREVIDNPVQFHKELLHAQLLARQYNDEVSLGFRTRIPKSPATQFSLLIDSERQARLTRLKTSKSKMKTSKSQKVLSFLDTLEEVYVSHNPLVPIDAAAGLTLGELMEVVRFRVNVLQAVIKIPLLEEQVRVRRIISETLKANSEYLKRNQDLTRIKAEMATKQLALLSCDTKLTNDLKELGVVLKTSDQPEN